MASWARQPRSRAAVPARGKPAPVQRARAWTLQGGKRRDADASRAQARKEKVPWCCGDREQGKRKRSAGETDDGGLGQSRCCGHACAPRQRRTTRRTGRRSSARGRRTDFAVERKRRGGGEKQRSAKIRTAGLKFLAGALGSEEKS